MLYNRRVSKLRLKSTFPLLKHCKTGPKVPAYLEAEAPLPPGVGDGEEGEEVAAEAEEDVERVEDHGEGRGALVTLN